VNRPDRLRSLFRDAVVACLSFQSQGMKRWEFRHLRRYILWVLFRLEKQEIVETTAGPPGQRFRMRLRWRLHTGYVVGMYEPEVIRAFRENLRQGDTCIDVGGHIGYLTLLMARTVGPKGKVVTFEPMADTFQVLQENVNLNGLKNVTLEQSAVGESETIGSLVFEANQRLTWTPSATAYGVRGESKSVSVRVASLDHYVRSAGLRPRLIKIDVEGAELDVLRGARRVLREDGPTVLVEVHGVGGEHEQAILTLLKECGYVSRPLEVRDGEAIYLALPGTGERR
jgi:FkbM family methyltransferase